MGGKAASPKAPPGVYRDDPDRDDAASTSSAVPLREDIGIVDEADPPPYVEDPTASLASRVRPPPQELDPKIEEWTHWDNYVYWTSWKQRVQRGALYTRLSPSLTSDPVVLQDYLEYETTYPPGAYIAIQGEHTETHGEGKERKTETKTDFSVRVDVTGTISAPGGTLNQDWALLRTVGHEEKTYRGSRFKKVHPGFKADVEDAPRRASLEEWCHLFCASSSALKHFSLNHRVVARDEMLLQRRIESIIRGTNYRGRIAISFQLDPYKKTLATPHLLNRLRNNTFVWWFFVLTQLWIITWPLLFFLTKRWAVVAVEWPFRKPKGEARQIVNENGERVWFREYTYASESEERWVKKWKRSIEEGILSGRISGETIAFVPDDPEAVERREADERRRRDAEPTEGFAGATMSILRGIGNITRENQDMRGWGYDT